MNLESPVSDLPFVGDAYERKLGRLEIKTVKDLLHHVPARYLDFRDSSLIANAKIGETITIKGEVTTAINQFTKNGRRFTLIDVADETGKINIVWFNQPYMIKNFVIGERYAFAGEISWFGKKRAMIAPEWEKENSDPVHTGGLIPVYPLTSGVTSKWLRRRVADVLEKLAGEIEEFLPREILAEYDLIDFATALKYVHSPKNEKEIETGRKRLAFNELFFLQLSTLSRKEKWTRNKASRFRNYDLGVKKFIKNLPFELTDSQKKAVKEILEDLKRDIPMNRLLEGDVGSGKTVVAAIAAYATFLNGFQTVLMAPTQILAQQHFETFKRIFDGFGVKIELVVSGSKRSNEKIDVFVGTHALIHRSGDLVNAALAVIDEQHRFGVEQRAHLIKKSTAPHVLTMTATPIPRTIALTAYEDLDLTILNELPLGRQKITTWIVPPQKREGSYKWIDGQIEEKNIQVFWVCPLIDPSEVETAKDVKSVSTEYEKLKTIFKNRKLGLLHGRLKTGEKNEVLEKFRKGEVDILVATPVVEVGIDVPNATIMVIEDADRFGLAQLHQLRGRVGRSMTKSYCLLFSEAQSEKVLTRLSALRQTHSGFELSEIDLSMRGPGEIWGARQSGFPELKIATWRDIDLIKQTREAANFMIK